MSECEECEYLRGSERVGDYSRAVDCRVLLARHPDHGKRLTRREAPEETDERVVPRREARPLDGELPRSRPLPPRRT
ncbi:hypothetical protein [Streptomyces sp. NPDC047097]|uniref:hypothetical protein n=1 Tax=Streptomyces sp. NPDC047097 TaxID=3155260 RepID=UPI0033E3F207